MLIHIKTEAVSSVEWFVVVNNNIVPELSKHLMPPLWIIAVWNYSSKQNNY